MAGKEVCSFLEPCLFQRQGVVVDAEKSHHVKPSLIESRGFMPTITTLSGEPVDLEEYSLEDESERLRLISSWVVEFDLLEEVDQEVNPSIFIPELQTYINEALEVKKRSIQLEFLEAGGLFGAVFWVFSFSSEKHGDFYALVARDYPITDLALMEKTFVTDSGAVVKLTPSQAALLDLFEPKE